MYIKFLFAANQVNSTQLWSEHGELQRVKSGTLEKQEEDFFADLIKKYLSPLKKDKDHEERVTQELKTLRNKCTVVFFLFNIVVIVMIFTLQIQDEKNGLYIPWPCGENLKIEPIGLMFIILFGIILVIQAIGMMIHSMETFHHIMASVKLCQNCSCKCNGNNNDATSSTEGHTDADHDTRSETQTIAPYDTTNPFNSERESVF